MLAGGSAVLWVRDQLCNGIRISCHAQGLIKARYSGNVWGRGKKQLTGREKVKARDEKAGREALMKGKKRGKEEEEPREARVRALVRVREGGE